MKPTIEFNCNEYRFNHGAMPRGRGSWAFVFRDHSGSAGDYTNDEIWWAAGVLTFGDAKKAARAEALRRLPGASVIGITVCS
jgi:hypothetical protein